MPKGKDKNEAAGAGVPRNLDVYQRLNFLMQAAQQQHGQQNDNLARYYAGLLRLVAEKTVLRLTPEVKERSCKYCNTWLSPEDTLSVRTKRKGRTVLVLKCRMCTAVVKRIPMKLARKPRATDTVTTEWTPSTSAPLPPPT